MSSCPGVEPISALLGLYNLHSQNSKTVAPMLVMDGDGKMLHFDARAAGFLGFEHCLKGGCWNADTDSSSRTSR